MSAIKSSIAFCQKLRSSNTKPMTTGKNKNRKLAIQNLKSVVLLTTGWFVSKQDNYHKIDYSIQIWHTKN